MQMVLGVGRCVCLWTGWVSHRCGLN